MTIQVRDKHYKELNELIAGSTEKDVVLKEVYGQRFIAAGLSGKNISIYGTPGNALGCYMDDCNITVYGNAQDQTGDTMNNGHIFIHGNCGDAAGYAMRGGEIYIKENTGYRSGIHMKEYKEKRPVVVIGGKSGCFLGEYQAGGIIVVLNLYSDNTPPCDDYIGVGMHGGAIYIRGNFDSALLPPQVNYAPATEKDIEDIKVYLETFSQEFGVNMETILSKPFTKLFPNSKNPYKQLYTDN